MPYNHVVPCELVGFLTDVATRVHSYYEGDRILVEDRDLRHSRLALLEVAGRILEAGLEVLGVSAPESFDNTESEP